MKGCWKAASIGLLGAATLFCQSSGDPVPAKWLHNGRLVVPEFNFSINSPMPNSHWTYRQFPNIQGHKETAFIVESSPHSIYFVIVMDIQTDAGVPESLVPRIANISSERLAGARCTYGRIGLPQKRF